MEDLSVKMRILPKAIYRLNAISITVSRYRKAHPKIHMESQGNTK
jgi:hypothetical protein